MNIVIAGGTGFIGSYLKKRFEEKNHKVQVVSRNKENIPWNLENLIKTLNTSDVLINLAGKNIDCRFSKKNKKLILDSRISTTSILNKAVSDCTSPPRIWINASASGIYNHTSEQLQDEYSKLYADDFLANVVKKWEEEFFSIEIPQIRKIALRTSVVLGQNGGAFPLLNRLSKTGLGGKQGNGMQMFSWIYLEDYFRIVEFIIENQTIQGVVNASSPYPVSNSQLMKKINKANKIFLALPSPKIILKIASYFLNFQPDIILDSVNVCSTKLKELHFEYIAPDLEMALNLLNNKT